MVAEGSVFSGFPTSEAGDTASMCGETSVSSRTGVSSLGTVDIRARSRGLPIVAMSVESKPRVDPFSQEACGTNIALSDDGLVATRRSGCRECSVVGSTPLPRQSRGLYFEVLIESVLDGWLGGLGIGVTHTAPGQLPRVPDKAWRIPDSFVVGYSGSAFLGCIEQRVTWTPDTLRVGQRV